MHADTHTHTHTHTPLSLDPQKCLSSPRVLLCQQPPPGAGQPASTHLGLPAAVACPAALWDTLAAFQLGLAKTALRKR